MCYNFLQLFFLEIIMGDDAHINKMSCLISSPPSWYLFKLLGILVPMVLLPCAWNVLGREKIHQCTRPQKNFKNIFPGNIISLLYCGYATVAWKLLFVVINASIIVKIFKWLRSVCAHNLIKYPRPQKPH